MRSHILPLDQSHHQEDSRTVLPFPSLIMALITRTRLKFPSGLTIIERDSPIGAPTMTRSKAISPDQKPAFLKSQGTMLRKKVGTQRRRLTGSHQPRKALHKHPPKHRHKHRDPIVLIVSLHEWSKCMVC